MERHGRVTWRDLERATARPPCCTKLRCYWTFNDCRYQKGARTCAELKILPICSLPEHDLRNGRLNQTAYSLFLFIRDVTDGDLVGWIDRRLNRASLGNTRGRTTRMRRTLIEPLRNLFGISDKVLNMALAHILTSAPSTKPQWLETGVNMNAIDRLVHAFMHRTGILRRFNAQHAYGTSLLWDGRLRRDRGADSFVNRRTKVQSELPTVLSTLRTTRDLAVLRAIGVEHLQRQSDRRPLSMCQRRLSVVPPLRPRGSATLNATTRRRNLAL